MGIPGFPNLDLGGNKPPPLDQQPGPKYDFSGFNKDRPNADMDKWDFLNLFIEQIKNQDPLNPMDGYEFAAQLAQFSTLEQQMKTNDLLKQVNAYEQSINSAQSIALLGKKVTALGNLLVVEGGKSTPCTYILPDAGEVTVRIVDAKGELVRTLEQGKEEAGLHTWTWDGKDEFGETVEDGSYKFEVTATNEKKLPLEVGHVCESVVSGVRYDENGNPQILIGPEVEGLFDDENQPIDPRIMVPLSDILEVAGVAVGTGTNKDKFSQIISRLKGRFSGLKPKPAALG